jgi:hypothetical protein
MQRKTLCKNVFTTISTEYINTVRTKNLVHTTLLFVSPATREKYYEIEGRVMLVFDTCIVIASGSVILD